MAVRFAEIQATTPRYDDVAADYAAIHRQFDAAAAAAGRRDAIDRWDRLRRRLESWSSLVSLRFSQDTAAVENQQALEYRDELQPKLTALADGFKRKLLTADLREEVREAFGDQAVAIWTSNISTYDPSIEEHLVDEAKLASRYIALLASAELELRGEQLSLSQIEKYQEHPDRTLRREAEQVRWQWYQQNHEALDALFGRLTAVRHEMAVRLGDPSFVDLGYRRMLRIDYGQADVAAFREAVRSRVTPLCERLVRRQQETLGLDEAVKYWDEPLLDPAGNPRPRGGHDWLIQRAVEMFSGMGHGLDAFFQQMTDGGFMDLDSRPHKAGGGFCTDFPHEAMPFIFANFNGTKGDVEVFTHEMGHAFQNFLSQSQPLLEYTWPTYESCEIHSMSLEFLCWPHMERFFGDDAERFRRIHLEQSLRFLPYGVAVDHFQHLVYQRPQATAQQRHEMWREMERRYLPWRDYAGLPHVADGGFWQRQRHIYGAPFYYIDYTLALTCALQFWVRSQADREQAMGDYVALCRRGGEAPFQELVKSAQLRSPFEPGCLDDVVDAARRHLGLG